MPSSYAELLQSVATFASAETTLRLMEADGDPSVLLRELPAIHSAIKERPDDVKAALLDQVPPELQQQASLIMRAFTAASAADIETLASIPLPPGGAAHQVTSAEDMLDRLRSPEKLSAVHRVVKALPPDVQRDLGPALPAAARPLVTMARDVSSDEFVEMAEELVGTLASAVRAEAVDEFELVSRGTSPALESDGYEVVSPGSSSGALSLGVGLSPSKSLGASPAADPADLDAGVASKLSAAATSSLLLAAAAGADARVDVEPGDDAEVILVRRGLRVPIASEADHAGGSEATPPTQAPKAAGGGLGGGLMRTAWLLIRSQLRLQAHFIASEAPLGNLRALCLAAASLAVGSGLIGTVGSLVAFEPASLILSVGLLLVSLILVVVEAEGETAAAMSGRLLARVPLLRSPSGRATLATYGGLIGVLAGARARRALHPPTHPPTPFTLYPLPEMHAPFL